jgi:GT2 family glycosyltransferase
VTEPDDRRPENGGPPVLTVLTVRRGRGDLAATLDSLRAQTRDAWEWLVVGPAVPGSSPVAPGDGRVRELDVPAGEPDTALDTALRAATGEHVLVLAEGDLLADAAVELLPDTLPPGAWGYSDEAQLFGPGRSPDLWVKPDFAPEWLRSQPYPVRSAFLPRRALLDAGGFRQGTGTATVYDAVLRLSEGQPGIRVPHPLVLRTDPDLRRRLVDGEAADHERVVLDHCRRTGIEVVGVDPVVVQGRLVGQRVRRAPTRLPSVSIVIPTRGSSSFVRGRARRHVVELVRSVWVPGRYPDLEVVVVYDTDTPEDVLDDLRSLVGDDLVLVPYDDWFHFSRKCNLGALGSRGELLCFLNDDTEVRTADWLHEMVSHLADPGVGAVGARLVFADGTLQHIGHHYVGGDPGHPLFGWWPTTLELGAAAQVAGERAGVTAACLLVRSADFLAVGGFSEAFPLNYNDVDLCLKLREAGFRLVYTAHAELYHFESQTRVARVLDSEVRQVRRRWGGRMRTDPYLRTARPPALRRRFAALPTAGVGTAPGAQGAPPAAPPDEPAVAEMAVLPTGGER